MSTSPAPRNLPYALVDVFAERQLEGNMLAIFTDAHGLSTAEMQALARETNLSETTFILPSSNHAQEAAEGVRVRIFTTVEELPFAGHPTLGTASWLFWHHPTLAGADQITLNLEGGPVTVRFGGFDPLDTLHALNLRAAEDTPSQPRAGIFGTMRQHDPTFGALHDPEVISRVTGIPFEDLDPNRPIQTVSTGLPFCIVPLRNPECVARFALSFQSAQTYLEASDAHFFYVFAPANSNTDADFHARMQFQNGEDPATGSASGCAIAYLVRHGLVAPGKAQLFEQGVEMRRPSRVYVRADLTDGTVTNVFVGGRTIPVATGLVSLS